MWEEQETPEQPHNQQILRESSYTTSILIINTLHPLPRLDFLTTSPSCQKGWC